MGTFFIYCEVVIQKPQGGTCGGKMGANAFNIMQYYNISSFLRVLILYAFATLCNIVQYFKNNILRLERTMSIGATVQVKSMLSRCLCTHGGTHGGTLFQFIGRIFFSLYH